MFKIAAFCLCALTICSGCKAIRRESCGPPITISVNSTTRDSLVIEIENKSKFPIKFARRDLPWGWRYSMWVKAFRDDAGGTPLEEAFTIADSARFTEPVVLEPGTSLRGEIDLNARFPQLQDTLKSRDVIVLWRYGPEIGDFTKALVFCGSITIPRLQ